MSALFAMRRATTVLRRGMAIAARPYVHGPMTYPDKGYRRAAPKTSEHKFSPRAGAATPTATWDPAVGVPPIVNDTNYKKQQTFTIVHAAEPKPAKRVPQRRTTPTPGAESASSLVYSRNDTRAWSEGSVPRPAAVNRLSLFNRPSLRSLIQSDASTIVHSEVSKQHNTVRDILRRATRSYPAHLKYALREHANSEREGENERRAAATALLEEVTSANAALTRAYADAKAGKPGALELETALEKRAAQRAAYFGRALGPATAGGVAIDAKAVDGKVELSVSAAGNRLPGAVPIAAPASGSTIDEFVGGAVDAAGNEKFVATPRTNIVDVGAAAAAGTAGAAAAASAEPVQLTWRVMRTPMKNLPVYRAYRNGGTRTVTILRNFRGDMKALRIAVQSVVGPDVAVVQRLGRIDILGDHVHTVRNWLALLGF